MNCTFSANLPYAVLFGGIFIHTIGFKAVVGYILAIAIYYVVSRRWSALVIAFDETNFRSICLKIGGNAAVYLWFFLRISLILMNSMLSILSSYLVLNIIIYHNNLPNYLTTVVLFLVLAGLCFSGKKVNNFLKTIIFCVVVIVFIVALYRIASHTEIIATWKNLKNILDINIAHLPLNYSWLQAISIPIILFPIIGFDSDHYSKIASPKSDISKSYDLSLITKTSISRAIGVISSIILFGFISLSAVLIPQNRNNFPMILSYFSKALGPGKEILIQLCLFLCAVQLLFPTARNILVISPDLRIFSDIPRYNESNIRSKINIIFIFVIITLVGIGFVSLYHKFGSVLILYLLYSCIISLALMAVYIICLTRWDSYSQKIVKKLRGSFLVDLTIILAIGSSFLSILVYSEEHRKLLILIFSEFFLALLPNLLSLLSPNSGYGQAAEKLFDFVMEITNDYHDY